MEESGELVHWKAVVFRELTHVPAVVDDGKAAAFESYLPGEEFSVVI